ncbi:ABC transporter family substrate-binding protein [Microlunatus sp. GCM10028923]|uniref:ABC transporter family substrate-binding protein n=1 Tax=Microlunatus sp. GCM10028923 TaxID=3273400 RepID=UPI0036106450
MGIGRKSAVAAIAALALSLAACGGGTSPNTEPTVGASELATEAQYNPQPRDNVKDGGTLTSDVPEISPQFNTDQADGTAYTLSFWRWYNPVMILFTPEGEWSANPDYLTDVKTEEKDGNTVVTYTINPKATFNDGTPIDWTAYETKWKATSGKDEKYLVSSTDGYSQIKSVVKGADDKQAVVTFDGVYAWVGGLFNNVLHPKLVDHDLFNKGYVNNPHAELGAGPYTVDKFDQKNGTLSFKRNDKWWGDPGKLDSRTFKALEDTAAINAFKNNQLDITAVATKDLLAQVQPMVDQGAVEIRKSASPRNGLMVVNSKHPGLDDAKVRQAVFMGIDRKVIADIAFQGLNYTEEPPGSFNLYGFQEGYQDNLTAAGYKYDKDAAGKLLDEAGWVPGSDGIREKGGKKLSITLPVIGDDPNIAARAKAINSMLKEIGVDAKIEQKGSNDFSKVFTEKQFGLFPMGFSSSDPFGFAYFCQVYCEPSSLNASGTGSEEINKKIAEVAKIGDPKAQIEAGNKLEAEIMAQTWGIMPLTNGPTILAAKKGLANMGAGIFYVGKPQDIGWQK